MSIEQTILSNLIHNEGYIRKVLPFLDERYFDDKGQKVVLSKIKSFFERYNERPTTQAIMIEVGRENFSQEVKEDVQNVLNTLKHINENETWLIDSTEQFCKQRSAYCGVLDAFDIIEGNDKVQGLDAIPSILAKALSVCFDTNVGHDYLLDAEKRFDYYHLSENKIQLDLELLNKITLGGLSEKSLNLILAGCVHPTTKVKVRYKRKI